MPTDTGKVHCTMPRQYNDPYHPRTMPTVSDKAHCTAPHAYKGQYNSSTVPIDTRNTMITVQPTAQPMTGRMTTKQVNPVQVHQESSRKALLEHCTHVHQPAVQVCKPGESLALRKVKHPLNGKTSVNRLPLMKQDILSQYSGCFEGIGHFPGDPYKFHLKPEHKPARHAPRKVPIHCEAAFKEEIESLVKQRILEEVKEHTDWVNSYVIVEKDTGNHHSPNHTVKKICLDPRDLNEALEREPYHTYSAEEITAKFLSRDRMEQIGLFPTSMEMYMDDCLTLTTEKTQQKQFQGKASEQCCSTHSISLDSQKNTILNHAEFPPSMESMPSFPGKQFLQRKKKFTLPDIENMPFFPEKQFLQGKRKSTLGTKLKPFMDTCTSTLGTDQQPFVDTNQKPSTSSKDTHKKGRMTATIGMTDMIGITLRTVNMITTHILMSSQPQDSFSNKEEYSTRQSTHKTQPLHQHRISV